MMRRERLSCLLTFLQDKLSVFSHATVKRHGLVAKKIISLVLFGVNGRF